MINSINNTTINAKPPAYPPTAPLMVTPPLMLSKIDYSIQENM